MPSPPYDNDLRNKVLAVACGGTGGHFYPGLSVAKCFEARGGTALLVVGGHNRDRFLDAAATAGMAAAPAAAVRAPASWRSLPRFACGMLAAVIGNARLLRARRVDVVLGMGGYTSVPLGLAAALTRRPLLLHEGNAALGRANRLLSRFARDLALSYPLLRPGPHPVAQHLVGMPVRPDLLAAAARPPDPLARAALRQTAGLHPDLPTLLVFGGSQGASLINERVRDALVAVAADERLQVVHLTGNEDPAPFAAVYAASGLPARVAAYDPNMADLYRLADFCICRAGGGTIAETTAFGIPALYIPLALAPDDHQAANAAGIVAAGGGFLLREADCTVAAVSERLAWWLHEPDAVARTAAAAAALARPQAAAQMVDLLAAALPGFSCTASQKAP